MEKFLIVTAASALAAKELGGDSFPFTSNELWTFLFILLAGFGTSWSKESTRPARGVFQPRRFWGSVGLGVAAGLCIPLLLDFSFQYVTGHSLTGKASIGLGILGAYVGRDALAAAWTVLQAVGTLLAKLKGLSVSFDGEKSAPRKKGGDDDANS